MPDRRFSNLVKTVETLRGPLGCPWDRKQKIKDLKNYLLEEVYELFDAIDKKKTNLIKEELGDLFLLLVFLSLLFKEKKLFSLEEVLENIVNKLILRHPHVFATKKLKTSQAVLNMWIKSKSKKKKRKTIYERIPTSSPALFSLYLYIKEHKHIRKGRFTFMEKEFNQLLKNYKKTKKADSLVEIIFLASCILSLRNNNPEFLIKRKVDLESSKIKYETSKA